MTTRQLGFQAPPTLALAAGAVSPNPGIAGVQVWSSTTNSLLAWDGNSWEPSGGGGSAPTDPLAWEAPLPASSFGAAVVHPFAAGYVNAEGAVAGYSAAPFALVSPTGANTYAGQRFAADWTNTAGSYAGCGVSAFWCDTFLPRGLIFEYAGHLATASSQCGYIGGLNRGGVGDVGVYGQLGLSDRFFGIGRDEGDPAGAAYVIVCNGTTRDKTLLTRTGAGYAASTGLQFRVQITIAPGANTMLLTVVDLSNDYPCLAAEPISLNGMSQTLGYSMTAMSATGAGGGTPSHRLYEFGFFPYPGNQMFAQSASNILGNAATATQLAASRTIQGVPFNGSANIDVVSLGAVAPASPTLNQLWIQTA